MLSIILSVLITASGSLFYEESQDAHGHRHLTALAYIRENV